MITSCVKIIVKFIRLYRLGYLENCDNYVSRDCFVYDMPLADVIIYSNVVAKVRREFLNLNGKPFSKSDISCPLSHICDKEDTL